MKNNKMKRASYPDFEDFLLGISLNLPLWNSQSLDSIQNHDVAGLNEIFFIPRLKKAPKS